MDDKQEIIYLQGFADICRDLQTFAVLLQMFETNNINVKKNNSQQAIDKMKYEIANEFCVNLGPDATSRANDLNSGRNH